jgi:hypothetical protein
MAPAFRRVDRKSRRETRQHRVAHAARERLAFGFVFLACPSMRWPKISWKNTPAARPEKIAGPRKWLDHRLAEAHIFGHLLERGQQHVVGGQ